MHPTELASLLLQVVAVSVAPNCFPTLAAG